MLRTHRILLCLSLLAANCSTGLAGSPLQLRDRSKPNHRYVHAPLLSLPITAPSDDYGRQGPLKSHNFLDDRCRTINEFAQLGDYDDDALDHLRHSCG